MLDAVDGYWRAIRTASTDPVDPASPELDRFASGDARAVAVDYLEGLVSRGQAVRYPSQPVGPVSREIIERSATSASVRGCEVYDGAVYLVADGTVVADAVEAASVRFELVLVDGQWKVAVNRTLASYPGQASCD
ncbi:MAG: hypothetical protein MUF83_03175 [Acidimicrobiales bacterium]|nr:hypothetical protein [Acidimicrobiales bacterium]